MTLPGPSPLGAVPAGLGFDVRAADEKLQAIRAVEGAWSLPELPDRVKADLAMQGGFSIDDMVKFLYTLDGQIARKMDSERAVDPIQPAPRMGALPLGLVAPPGRVGPLPDPINWTVAPPAPPREQELKRGLDWMGTLGGLKSSFAEIASIPPPSTPDGDAVIRYKQEAIRMGILPEDFPVDRTWGPEMQAIVREMNFRKFNQRVQGHRAGGLSLGNLMDLADEWLSPTNLAGIATQMGYFWDAPHIADETANWVSGQRWAKVSQTADEKGWLHWDTAREFFGFVIGPVDDIALPILNIAALFTGVGEIYTTFRATAVVRNATAALKAERIATGGLSVAKAVETAFGAERLLQPAGRTFLNGTRWSRLDQGAFRGFNRMFNPLEALNRPLGQVLESTGRFARPGVLGSRFLAAEERGAMFAGAKVAMGQRMARWRQIESVIKGRRINQQVMRMGQLGLMEATLFPSNPQSERIHSVLDYRRNHPWLYGVDLVADLGFSPYSIMPEDFYRAPWTASIRAATRRTRQAWDDMDSGRLYKFAQAWQDLLSRSEDPTRYHAFRSAMNRRGPRAAFEAVLGEDADAALYYYNEALVMAGISKGVATELESLPTGLPTVSARKTEKLADFKRKRFFEIRQFNPQAQGDALAFLKESARHAERIKPPGGVDEFQYWSRVERAVDIQGELHPNMPYQRLREMARELGITGQGNKPKAELLKIIETEAGRMLDEGGSWIEAAINSHNETALLKTAETIADVTADDIYRFVTEEWDNLDGFFDYHKAQEAFMAHGLMGEGGLIDGDAVRLVGQTQDGKGLFSKIAAEFQPEHSMTHAFSPAGDPALKTRWVQALGGDFIGGRIPLPLELGPGTKMANWSPFNRSHLPVWRMRMSVARKDSVMKPEKTAWLAWARSHRMATEGLFDAVHEGGAELLSAVLASRKVGANFQASDALAIIKRLAKEDPDAWRRWHPGKQKRMAAAAEAIIEAGITDTPEDLARFLDAMVDHLDSINRDTTWKTVMELSDITEDASAHIRRGHSADRWRFRYFDQLAKEAELRMTFTATPVANVNPQLAARLDELGYVLVYGEDFHLPWDVINNATPQLNHLHPWRNQMLRLYSTFQSHPEKVTLHWLRVRLKEEISKELTQLKNRNPEALPDWFDLNPEGGHIDRIATALQREIHGGQVGEVAREQAVNAGSKLGQRWSQASQPRVISQMYQRQVRRALWSIANEAADLPGVKVGLKMENALSTEVADAIYTGVRRSQWLGDWRVAMRLRTPYGALQDWIGSRKVSEGVFQVLSASRVKQLGDASRGPISRYGKEIASAAIGGLYGAATSDENPLAGAVGGALAGGLAGRGLNRLGAGERLGFKGALPEGETFRFGSRAAGAVLGQSLGDAFVPAGEDSDTANMMARAAGAMTGFWLGPGVARNRLRAREGAIDTIYTRLRDKIDVLNPIADTSWRHYTNLSHHALRLSSRLRFTLSPIFDLQRYMEGAQLTLTELDIPLDLKSKLPLFGRGRSSFVRHYDDLFKAGKSKVSGEQAWGDALARFRAASRGRPIHDSVLDEVGRWITDEGLFGFNPTHRMVTMFVELENAGVPAERAYEVARKVYTYGIHGRSQAELTMNFMFFPFSFQSRLIGRWGKFLADETGRTLLLHDMLKMGEVLDEQYNLSERWRKHLPVLNTLRKLNSFAFGISPGELGGIHRPWIDLFMPAAMWIKTGAESWSETGSLTVGMRTANDIHHEALDLKQLTSRLVPLVRDSKYLWDDIQDQGHALTGPSGMSRREEAMAGWDLLRQYQGELDRVAIQNGYSDWTSFSRTPQAQPWVDAYRSYREGLAVRYPEWENSIAGIIEYRFLVNRELEGRARRPQTNLDYDIAEFLGFERYLETVAKTEGVDFSDIENLPVRYFDQIRAKALQLQARGNGFSRIWKQYYSRTYGPITTPIWRA